MTEAHTPHRDAAPLLLATVAVTTLPHVLYQPFWLSALSIGLIALRAVLLVRPYKLPSWLLIAIGAAVAFAIRQEFGYFFGQEPGVALLVGLLCLKQLESRTRRDLFVAVLLSLFLQLSLFFYDQTLLSAIAAIGGIVLACATLVALQHVQSKPRANLRTAASLLLQGLPIMLLMFLLFPRIQGPLWGLPADADSARTGLSDHMSPGDISNLSQSHEIAFRAEFDGPPPPRHQRYWRGPVLSLFDGKTWRPQHGRLDTTPAYTVEGQRYDYTLAMEPHGERWMLALDFPGENAPNAIYSREYQLLAKRPIRMTQHIRLSAYPDTRPGMVEADIVLQRNLQLPRHTNPKTQAIGQRLAENNPSPERILQQAIETLRQMDLIYTLQPPKLEQHPVDEFLFDTRRGFCEHFASAFVFLMRSANVPARVVTGYQGGEINPADGSLIVRQSDAHAWAEVWLSSRGWVRVDPTAIVAPSRIEQGLANALPDGETIPFLLRPSMSWMLALRNQWEALSYRWDKWVLGYDLEQQKRLLQRLGIDQTGIQGLAILLVSSIALVILALLGWALLGKPKRDPLLRAWDDLSTKLAARGLSRHSWEGPLDFGRRASAQLPQHAPALLEIASTYAQLRYGETGDDTIARRKRLIHRIRTLRLK